MDEIAELRDALDRLGAAMEDLAVRGLRAAGPRELAKLEGLRDEFRAAGAGHVAQRLESAISAARADDRGAAAKLLAAMTATRLLERMLTLEVAAGALGGLQKDE